ncbi:MAG TPA: 5'-3' exonuclease H3TH domain-containing protein, partial [Candidatus Krumholzibacteria bacterium]|nr:5'-3' exonuclease H3TH domain-containing protein [Candidatus Krumholzibacteria bacterium]
MAGREERTIYLVDASIYIFRSWFSLPDTLMASDGAPVNAVYGFMRFLTEFFENARPSNVMVAFDQSLTTSFRNEIYPDYKANRDPAPPELKVQLKACERLVESLGISCLKHPRFEADDLIASVAVLARENGYRVVVVSGDKDLSQVVHEGDLWWDYARNRKLDMQGVYELFGVWPNQIKDFLALVGDAVDNIPGVPGIGPKTASRLLRVYKDVDQLYERLEEVPRLGVRGAARLARELGERRESVMLARRLTALACDAPAGDQSPHHRIEAVDRATLDELLAWMARGEGYVDRIRSACSA